MRQIQTGCDSRFLIFFHFSHHRITLMQLDFMQNLKARLQAVTELCRFVFSLDLVICHFFFFFFFCSSDGMNIFKRLLFDIHIWLGHETAHTSTIPSIEDCQINFRSFHDSFRLKIMTQNHTNFHLAKIVGIWKGSGKTIFLICMWWCCITKRFLTIAFHKNT